MLIRVNFGHAHSINVSPNMSTLNVFTIYVMQPNGDRQVLAAKRDAMRALWAYLTQILYPRAINITKQMETIVQKEDSAFPNLTYRLSAYRDEQDPYLVVIGGLTPTRLWSLTIEEHACENLWAALHDHLGRGN